MGVASTWHRSRPPPWEPIGRRVSPESALLNIRVLFQRQQQGASLLNVAITERSFRVSPDSY